MKALLDIYGKMDAEIKNMVSDSNVLLEIDKLANNPNALIIIQLPTLGDDGSAGAKPGSVSTAGPSVTGYIISDFGFGLAASWGGMDLVSSAQRQFQRFANLATMGINQFLNYLQKYGVRKALPQNLYMSLLQTVSAYEGTEKPTINLPLIFIARNPEDDVRQHIFTLLRCVVPIYQNAIMLKAPLGYAFDVTLDKITEQQAGRTITTDGYGVTNITGTISLKIGNWFELVNLVVKGVDFVFSKEVTPAGWPLYARANVSFEPILMWTLTDIQGMFKGMANTKTPSVSSPKGE